MTQYDVAVIGCGAMGASASNSLASKGLKVLTVEQFGLNHKLGSSHGGTRIIRQAYAEDPRYVPLVRRAFELWEELQAKAGKTLIRLTGGLMVGSGDGGLVRDTLTSAMQYALPHRVMSGREVNENFPAFSLEDEETAVFEERAGILFPEECVSTFVGEAKLLGCDFKFEEQVSGWRGRKEGIEIRTEKETYSANKLVFCSGAWTGPLIPGVVPLECERQVPMWFDAKGDPRFGAERMPIFVAEEADARTFYGIPDVGQGVKAAMHHGGKMVAPETVDREVTEDDVRPVREFISRKLSGLNPEPISSTTCLYTNTPDSNFVVDFHPDDERVMIVSACSGHGFKFAPVLGEVVSDLLTVGKTTQDISFLGISRFSRKPLA
ncbi:MAG: N-methyl-L-tryptophan oxidase [Thaumarchaeota archaeon]|nr:N-methyl-L-tryptophan oxidase [Nitrososphaerota archaeon]